MGIIVSVQLKTNLKSVLFSGKKKSRTKRPAIKIDEDLYLEGHYDTETLIKIVKNRILNVVGYDYRGIKVVIKRG